jgi:hypothetical protein
MAKPVQVLKWTPAFAGVTDFIGHACGKTWMPGPSPGMTVFIGHAFEKQKKFTAKVRKGL